jgi:hypothetical protein
MPSGLALGGEKELQEVRAGKSGKVQSIEASSLRGGGSGLGLTAEKAFVEGETPGPHLVEEESKCQSRM